MNSKPLPEGTFVSASELTLMRYMGGKSRLAKKIAAILSSYRSENQPYIEPFVGGASVLCQMTGDRTAHDINPHLIALWQAVADGTFVYPETVTEADHKAARARKDQITPDPYLAFVGFGCCFGGDWFAGYAKCNEGRDYVEQAKSSTRKKAPLIQGVKFSVKNYVDLAPHGALIYCDPPYRGTTECYRRSFDSDQFWERARELSRNNTVIVSEYSAPSDWTSIAEFPIHTQWLRRKRTATERLFKLAA